ncbi:unnamed protein product, partial [Cuscuta europaea]
MRMKENEKVIEYINRVMTIANHMKRNGETVSESRIVEKILRTLTDKFENVVCTIEEARNIETLTIDDLSGSLEAHEQRKMKQLESLEEALQTVVVEEKAMYAHQPRGRGRGHFRGRGQGRGDYNREENTHQNREDQHRPTWRGRGHFRGRGQGRGDYNREENTHQNREDQHRPTWRGRGRGAARGGRGGRPDGECYNCGKRGHFARDCWSKPKPEENLNVAEHEDDDGDEEGVLLLAHKEGSLTDDATWYLDTGASNHMSGYKHLFTELKEAEGGNVSFGDTSKVVIKGRGKV